MKYTLITLLAFSMLFFNACEVTNCTAESNKLRDNEWWNGSLSSDYTAYLLDISDDTADSTDSGFGAEYKEHCQDFVDVLQDLEESGCSERTDISVPAYTQDNVNYYQSSCDAIYDDYCDHPSNDCN